jgi:acetyl esterase/lipase
MATASQIQCPSGDCSLPRIVNKVARTVFWLCIASLATACSLGPPLPDDARLVTDVIYAERESGPLSGRLFVPAGVGPHPAVLLLHGGGWRNGAPRQMDGIGRRLAGEGFVAFSAAYRLAPSSRYPAQLDDVRDAFLWLIARDEVDPTRTAAWGYSAGAQLALLLGFNPVPGEYRPNAVVAGGTPAVFELFDPQSRLLRNYLGGSREAAPEVWADASPIQWVSPDDPPIYLYHGQTDGLVDIEHARRLARALTEARVQVTLDEVRGGHLGVFLYNRGVEARAAVFLKDLPAAGHLKKNNIEAPRPD